MVKVVRLRFISFLICLTISILTSAEPSQAQKSLSAQLLTDLGIEMLLIPGGQFNMGSENGDPDEQPIHPVKIQSFYLSKYEVSFRQWDICVSAGGCNHQPGDSSWGRGARPVMLISWIDAKEFVNWLNEQTGDAFRLPSEAEWEYAARAGSPSRYHWGEEDDCSRANYHNKNGQCGLKQQTKEIGHYAANAFGLNDMHGNVSEWVEDCYQTDYTQASPTGKANTKLGCEYRILRGGSWLSRAENIRSARRIWFQPMKRYNSFGFRLAKDS